MYYPECYFHPSSIYSPYYICTTSYENGGVHLNSGVLNHLYAVLVDGGKYLNPSKITSSATNSPLGDDLITITPLGFVKALNLFWRAYLELTSTSQYLDFALALNVQCTLNIGTDLFIPNVFNSSVLLSRERLTRGDCNNVKNALIGSGIINSSKICPNIIHVSANFVTWKKCTHSELECYYEVLFI